MGSSLPRASQFTFCTSRVREYYDSIRRILGFVREGKFDIHESLKIDL